jgi:sterol 14alpha-demethylase
MVIYGMEPYKFFINARAKVIPLWCHESNLQYGDYFTFVLGGRRMHVALGPKGNDLVLNAKLAYVSAEEAYTPLTTPVFGTGVVYDCPNHVLMQQKKFVKYGMTTEAFKSYVPLIVEEVMNYFNTSPNFGKDRMNGSSDAMATSPQITIFTASRTLQGPEVRKYFDASFAKLYKDLDNGFTPVNFLFPHLPLPANRKRDFAQRKMASIYRDIINQRRAMKEEDHPPDMIWNLMNQQYKDGRPPTDTEVAHMMIALLMAGQHTSMATSSWAILHLGAKPEYMYHPQSQRF